ncbi:MAG: sigma-54 dependent transcriptional regulator [Gammaproteobacteria bacterium]
MANQNMRHQPILLVDDESQLLKSASLLLRSDGYKTVLTLDNSREVMPLLAKQAVGAVVLDLNMPGVSGQDLLEKIGSDYPHIPVIIMTALDEIDTAVRCMQLGAYDYLTKPVAKERLVSSLHRALDIHALHNEVSQLKQHLLTNKIEHQDAFSKIITQNQAMFAVFRYMEAIAASQQPVLITGDTGTGKELFARAMHELSGRNGDFVADNVAGLDDAVFADTLFGHNKGAFTGADRIRQGLIAKAEDGTLFLDEIGDLTASSQIKLLRLLQEHTYFPIGSDKPNRTNARIIVATHCDVDKLVAKGGFRKDLYYRLHAHRIHIPMLHERLDDLPLLVEHFLEKAASALDKKVPTAPPELITLLKSYNFPGNVRELEGMIHNAVACHQGGVMSLDTFRSEIGVDTETIKGVVLPEGKGIEALFTDRIPTLKQAEQYLIEAALQQADNNQGIAAGMLGLTRQALNKRLVRGKKAPENP